MKDPLVELALYLTSNSLVVKHSAQLQHSYQMPDAVQFFALREAFGVTGYMRAEEALANIKAILADHARNI